MSGAFSSIDIGRTGVGFSHAWMDTIAHNIANVNTVTPGGEEPFRAQMIVAQEITEDGTGGGVAVGGMRESDEDGAQVYDPGHPLADANGNVTTPSVDLAAQMADLMVANRSYQANLRTIQSAREAYEAALRLGQPR